MRPFLTQLTADYSLSLLDVQTVFIKGRKKSCRVNQLALQGL